MKILSVEGHPILRECIEIILHDRNHLIIYYLPEESIYGRNKDLPQFQSPEGLTALIAELNPEAVILDRETFSKEESWSGDLFRKYLTPVLQKYSARLLATTTLPKQVIEEFLAECFSPDNRRIKVLGKPYPVEELISALEE